MIIQKAKVRIPLLAKDGFWKFRIEEDEYELHDCIERLLANYIFNKNSGYVARWLRECYNQNITIQQIDSFIEYFEKSHPTEEIEEFCFEFVPLYAGKDGLTLPLPGCCCQITLEQEKELMLLAKTRKGDRLGDDDKRIIRLENWFFEFRHRYGLNFKRLKHQQDTLLAEAFLEQHGLQINLLKEKPEVPPPPQPWYKELADSLGRIFIFVVVVLIWGGIWMGLMTWGNSLDNFLVGFIISSLGVVAFSAPFLYLRSK
jgi:hypothetical protein